tara:strand:+ start:1213 stop:1752 length:540 start_codon:yes stop_codon:yes gene_type:complete
MSFTKIKPDGNGGYNLFEKWTIGDDILVKILPMILALPLILFISLILPMIFWLIAPLSYVKENHENTYFGLTVSLLFFLDLWFGGLLWTVFHTTQNEGALYFFGALQIVFVLINIVRLYLYNSDGGELPAVLIFIIFALSIYFGYDVLSSMAEDMSSSTPCFWIEEFYNEEMLELTNGY